jgi:hypothetical protein
MRCPQRTMQQGQQLPAHEHILMHSPFKSQMRVSNWTQLQCRCCTPDSWQQIHLCLLLLRVLLQQGRRPGMLGAQQFCLGTARRHFKAGTILSGNHPLDMLSVLGLFASGSITEAENATVAQIWAVAQNWAVAEAA